VVLVPRRVQTLLFTDVVSSTDRLRELGDAADGLRRIDEASRPAGASREQRLDAMALGLVGQTIERAGGFKQDATLPCRRRASVHVLWITGMGLARRSTALPSPFTRRDSRTALPVVVGLPSERGVG
jgi:hypothetical protein